MSSYLIVAFVGLALVILVGYWLAKKAFKVAALAMFLGAVAAAIYWFSHEDLPTTVGIAEYLSTYVSTSIASLF